MNNEISKVVDNLLNDYDNCFSNKPDGVRVVLEDDHCGLPVGATVPPTIPFVGKNYNQNKVLVYASAENLIGTLKHLKGHNFQNRHRSAYENCRTETTFENNHFPQVFCEPFHSGGLTTAAAYICKRLTERLNLQNIKYDTPSDFLESIAFGNFSKFSYLKKVGEKDNKDVAEDLDFLKKSFEYIKSDLKNLKPNLVILPKTTYETICRDKEGKNLLSQVDTVVTIWQINQRVLNRDAKNLATKDNFFMSNRQLFVDLDAWGKQGDFSKQKNFHLFFAHLDERIAQKIEKVPQL